MNVSREPWHAIGVVSAVVLFACGSPPADERPLDLAIVGGRVMDPESGLDAPRNVGVRGSEIAVVTEDRLTATDIIDATGLVVAPGFIDLHAHGQDHESSRYQIRDGVTTALELEIGAFPIESWYASRGDGALVNYGASVSHQLARRRAMGGRVARANAEGTFSLGESSDETLYRGATDDELSAVSALVEEGLAQGGLGIGVGLSYTPGASHEELLRLFGVAADHGVPIYIHLRSSGEFRRGGALAPFQEVVANAAATGASVHIVHLNSSAGSQAEHALTLIRGARARGLDVTTEAYPYTASASMIESPLFDGYVARPAEAYRSLQWVETGERLTPESFATYRERGGWVIMHGRSEETNEWVTAQPDVIAASDGIPFSEGRSHPRGAGTFARVLGHYARDRQALSLMDAVRKMTLLPAQRLEQVVSQMADKGRIRVGADADLTVFDPDRVIDRATYDAPDQYSAGIVHVLVGGIPVVRDEQIVDGVAPGRPVRAGGSEES
jgi:N-acyl-D-aspartate/D-glutamate deacylase